MQIAARLVMYALLGLMCLVIAGAAFGIGAGVAGYVCIVLLSLLGFLESPSSIANWIIAGCAMLGGGYSLLFLIKTWIRQGQQSDDPILRKLANDLDELGRAMTGKSQ